MDNENLESLKMRDELSEARENKGELLRDRIMAATWEVHKRLDRSQMARRILSKDCGIDDYLAYLKVTYGFVRPLEESLRRFFSAHDYPRGIGPQRLTKTFLLERDMEALGHRQRGNVDLPVMPYQGVAAIAEAMGVMYVLEGSTMGGLVIGKNVNHVLGYTREFGSSFLSCYGGAKQTIQKFEEFVSVLNVFAETERDCELAQSAAREAFIAIDSWLQSCGCG